MEVIVHRFGKHATVRYGDSIRVLPVPALRTERAAEFVAQILWDHEHPDATIRATMRQERGFEIRQLADDIVRGVSGALS